MSQIKVEQLTDEQKQAMNIPAAPENVGEWSVWGCEPSTFDWTYDAQELAYVYEGKVTVKTAAGDVEIQAGDYVIFPAGLSCTWVVREAIKKVYQFK